MREAMAVILIGSLFLVPLVVCDESDAVNRYDVVFFDLTSHEKWSCEIKEGDTIEHSAAYIWNNYPYWYDIDTGYKWDGNTPVTCDLHLHASETEPPSAPDGFSIDPRIIGLSVVAIFLGVVFILLRRR